MASAFGVFEPPSLLVPSEALMGRYLFIYLSVHVSLAKGGQRILLLNFTQRYCTCLAIYIFLSLEVPPWIIKNECTRVVIGSKPTVVRWLMQGLGTLADDGKSRTKYGSPIPVGFCVTPKQSAIPV